MIVEVAVVSALAGAGIYAALKGVFGTSVEATAKADEAAVKAAVAKAESAVKSDISKL